MINLFDTYNQASWDLHYSLLVSGYNNPTVVINDDGFLPEDVTSPYLFFTGFDPKIKDQALYFNQVPVPKFWEIRGNNTGAEIYDYHTKKGQIHYTEPAHKRLVKSVDWFDEKGVTRATDRYNKQGYRFSQVVYNRDGQAVLTSYFDQDGKEVLVEHHGTGDITLNYQGKVYIFKTRVDFIIFYLRATTFNLDRIFYNSLATPFMVAHHLGGQGRDVLFWQEKLGDAIPGNMDFLLRGKSRQTQVAMQDGDTYQKAQSLLADEQKALVGQLGLMYPTSRTNRGQKEALILTNTDQVEELEKLVKELPELTFHIGALTEMSSRLTDMGQYANVKLYPNIATTTVKKLYQDCDIYLDINKGNEILSALRKAFENQQLIMAFDTTAHKRQYTAKHHIYATADGMIGDLKAILISPLAFEEAVIKQKEALGLAKRSESVV